MTYVSRVIVHQDGGSGASSALSGRLQMHYFWPFRLLDGLLGWKGCGVSIHFGNVVLTLQCVHAVQVSPSFLVTSSGREISKCEVSHVSLGVSNGEDTRLYRKTSVFDPSVRTCVMSFSSCFIDMSIYTAHRHQRAGRLVFCPSHPVVKELEFFYTQHAHGNGRDNFGDQEMFLFTLDWRYRRLGQFGWEQCGRGLTG